MSSSNNNLISIPVGAIGATGASGSVTGAVGVAGGYTSILTSGGTGGAFGGSGITSTNSYNVSYTTVSNPVYYTNNDAFGSDIVLKRKSGKSIKLGETLDLICDLFCIILPDKQLLEQNPALKAAYENHLELLRQSLGSAVQDSYNSYRTIEKLVLEKDDQTDI
jgi:hypothetical protein